MYYTYMLRCADGSLYTGITTDPARRFAQHTGKLRGGAKYTASRRPVCMEAIWRAPGHTAAAQLEARIKTLTKTEKEQLIRGHVPDRLSLTSFSRIQTEPDGRRIPMLFVCYPKCSTCKKARAFLDARDIPVEVRDIKEQNPTEQELRDWHAKSGLPLKRLFNTSGQLYRSLELSKKLPDMSEDEQFALLASDGMLVRRPVLVADGFALFGFKQKEWEELL
ncbi:hypothetical protein CBW42_00070 [Butyricicoccus porcorum]|uniref:GIY-YIG domain-containing protein n=3 Tax=Butyricicoccus porcorum TaxID=1945634 RepID=A0A252F7B4_9FIRM|nr:hypothetical protein CBW42_00070 [Butyricicoccus porcorum]